MAEPGAVEEMVELEDEFDEVYGPYARLRTTDGVELHLFSVIVQYVLVNVDVVVLDKKIRI
jgi:hypothetical protein